MREYKDLLIYDEYGVEIPRDLDAAEEYSPRILEMWREIREMPKDLGPDYFGDEENER